jgi:hypothetical protein
MRHFKLSASALILTLAALVPAAAQSPATAPESPPDKSTQGTLVLTRWTIDAGGTTSASGGNWRLGATIGQPEAALVAGGPYQLSAGFWAPETGGDGLFANGFE